MKSNSKLKILFYCYGHFDSGLELYKSLKKYSNCDLLVQLHEDYLIQSSIEADTSDIDCGISEGGGKKLDKEIEIKFGIELDSISYVKYPTLSLRDFKNLKISRKLCKWINDKKYDVVIYYGSSLVWLQHYIFLRKSIKRVYTIHDYIAHTGENKTGGRQYDFYMKAITLIKSNLFILISEVMRNQFCDYYKVSKKRAEFIKFGIFYSYLNNIRSSEEINERVVLFFGRISKYKGIEYLIEATRNLKSKYINLKTIIAGNGEYYFDVSNILEDETFEIINEHITNEMLSELIQKSDFVVCPYTDATQSGVVMTAYAFNKPVIATRVGSFNEYVIEGKTGYLVPPKNVNKLTETMDAMLQSPFKINEMESFLRNHKEEYFSWDVQAEKLLSFLSNQRIS